MSCSFQKAIELLKVCGNLSSLSIHQKIRISLKEVQMLLPIIPRIKHLDIGCLVDKSLFDSIGEHCECIESLIFSGDSIGYMSWEDGNNIINLNDSFQCLKVLHLPFTAYSTRGYAVLILGLFPSLADLTMGCPHNHLSIELIELIKSRTIKMNSFSNRHFSFNRNKKTGFVMLYGSSSRSIDLSLVQSVVTELAECQFELCLSVGDYFYLHSSSKQFALRGIKSITISFLLELTQVSELAICNFLLCYPDISHLVLEYNITSEVFLTAIKYCTLLETLRFNEVDLFNKQSNLLKKISTDVLPCLQSVVFDEFCELKNSAFQSLAERLQPQVVVQWKKSSDL
jgi:hypothetical protein